MRHSLLLLCLPFLLAPVCRTYGEPSGDSLEDTGDSDGLGDTDPASDDTDPASDDTDPAPDSDGVDTDDTDPVIGNRVDIHWVLDNSGSMEDEQNALATLAGP